MYQRAYVVLFHILINNSNVHFKDKSILPCKKFLNSQIELLYAQKQLVAGLAALPMNGKPQKKEESVPS